MPLQPDPTPPNSFSYSISAPSSHDMPDHDRDVTPPTTPPPDAIPRGNTRSFSGASISSTSSRSSVARSDIMVRRRGFMRPQGTEFSTSARSRESVMALGSIAHLQYFFAKTGQLDGRGGGLKKKRKEGEAENGDELTVDVTASNALRDSTYSSLRSSPEMLLPHEQDFFAESPDHDIDDFVFDESIMLPPTTSTYNPRTKHLPPAPDPDVLRVQLRDLLRRCRVAWADIGVAEDGGGGEAGHLPEGAQELFGAELIEVATTAIKAAKTYYYATDISLLTLKDDRTLREEFLDILDVLRRVAQRKYSGGITGDERDSVLNWISGVETALCEEERAIAVLRQKGRDWLEGDWKGLEYERYRSFLVYFDPTPDPLPPYQSSTTLPTPFLSSLQSGLRLILIHNAVVRRSKRPFGQIPTYHTEFSKPYRLAENLRYWKKAAEIRWEIRLKFDVAAVVNGTEDGWREFERDIGLWCHKVLKEVCQDWERGEGAAAVGQVRSERASTLTSTQAEVGD